MSAAEVVGLLVFPAYAGMNRLNNRPAIHTNSVPRICGDEPGTRTNRSTT